MVTASHSDSSVDALALYFLCWLDAIERLDTVLLEVRHLQQNIIYLLRCPALYHPLRYEENFLRGWDGWEMLADTTLTQSTIRQLPWCWVLTYPLAPPMHTDITSFSNAWQGLSAKHKPEYERRGEQISTSISDIVDELVGDGRWNSDQRAHYFRLHAIQELKRQIVLDKVILCREGLRIFVSPIAPGGPACSRFLLLRSAVLARAREYVARLGDHLNAFAHSQDYGLHDHPRPGVQRRRDQHMYIVHLRDRCRNIAIEMSLLVAKLKSEPDPESRPLVFHRWQETFTSQNYTFENELRLEEPDAIVLPYTKSKRQHYVNTSYWMPERPDLQSVIAHEVAHTVIRERFSDLPPQALDRDQGSFSRLLKELNQCLEVFDAHRDHTDAPEPLRELAVDLLATAIKGPAYVYALFLELVGAGTEDLFAAGESGDRFELERIDYLEGITGDYGQSRDWYFRLHVVCAWLEAIFPFEPLRAAGDKAPPLAQRLIKACRLILDNLLKFLDQIAAPRAQTAVYWEGLGERLCTIVRQSRAARETKSWLQERERDDRVKTCGGWDKGNRRFPRSTRTLHWRVRNFLVDGLRDKKEGLLHELYLLRPEDSERVEFKDKGKRIGRINRHFRDIYALALDVAAGEAEPKLKSPTLFRRLYDIPWQCGMMRGLDFMDDKSILRRLSIGGQEARTEWLWQMHYHAALGRELYQVALDFYAHDVGSASERLTEAIRVVAAAAEHKGSLKEKIAGWLGKSEGERNERIKGINNRTDKARRRKAVAKLTDDYSARELAAAFRTSQSEQTRRSLEKLQGHELTALQGILRSNGIPPDEQRYLAPLLSFLEVRLTEEFHSQTLDILSYRDQLFEYDECDDATDERHHIKEKRFTPIPAYMLTRICTAGSYTQYDQYAMPLKESIWPWETTERYRWHKWCSLKGEGGRHVAKDRNEKLGSGVWDSYYTLLGRYDVLSIGQTRPMSRSWIPQFEKRDGCESHEKYPSFFTRRELVIPLRLRSDE